MADIICPHCNMPNPDDQSVCSFCREPLRTTQDSGSIHPGDMPTKKTTAELEPILPPWLREARANARQSAADEKADEAEAAAAQPAAQEPAPTDWLAGLDATAREEEQEEVPEWMRGAPASPPVPARQKKVDDTFPRRQEIHWEAEPSDDQAGEAAKPLGATQSDDGIPSWMKGLDEEPAEEKSEVSDFLSKQDSAQPARPSPFESGTFRPNTGELFDWLDDASKNAGLAPAASSPGQPAGDALPDWMANLGGDRAAQPASNSAPTEAGSFDWLKEEASKPFAPFQKNQTADEAAAEQSFGADLDLPDWMKSAAAEAPAPQQTDGGLPDWMKPTAAQPPLPQPQESSLSDWMKSAAEAPVQKEEPGLPDWMKSQQGQAAPAEQGADLGLPSWVAAASQIPEPQAETKPEVPVTPPGTPAFIQGEEPVSAGGADELFSANLPDWLSNIAPAEQTAATIAAPQPEKPQEAFISPADLPSWVQAMRPVETTLQEVSASADAASQPLENQGPLAGLRGVLPAMPGFAPSSKPRAYSVRLQPTQDQLDHATLLEQMLASETTALPLRTDSSVVLSQRVLRWFVAGILLVLIVAILFSGVQLLPLPSQLSPEGDQANSAINDLPDDAPVLMIFDYEPALAGEMEAAAGSFVDQVIALHHPRLTLLSTSPTGPALAERFMTASQTRGQNYINLGYLPGESSGILAFAMNPRSAIPNRTVWDVPIAQDVTRFSDYQLVILLTDRAETARAWVEQTTGQREGHPFVIVSSAQAAPLIQPYLLSGQVTGLVSGLREGAAFEQATNNYGLARQYWDAYNLSILVVCIMIVIGGLWNLALGIRSRRQGLDEG
jgi:hypothetical protein